MESRAAGPGRELGPDDPTRVGPYEIDAKIGEGGMGAVYLGRDAEGRRVAVKVVRPELADDRAFLARFQDEARNAERVASFCTAQVLDHGTDLGLAYLVTEYIDGPSLLEHISEHGPLQPGMLHGVAVGVAAALVAIHASGLVHRDLKPSNVLLSITGPRVIDFGIARALDMASSHTKTGQLVGTPGYIAPEQVLTQQVTPAVDIFAWGCLLAYAANGRNPFGQGSFQIMMGRAIHAEPELGALTEPLASLARAALSKAPEQRPTSRDLLLNLVGGGASESAVTTSLGESWLPPPLPDVNGAPESAPDRPGAAFGQPGPPPPFKPDTEHGQPGPPPPLDPATADRPATDPGRSPAGTGDRPNTGSGQPSAPPVAAAGFAQQPERPEAGFAQAPAPPAGPSERPGAEFAHPSAPPAGPSERPPGGFGQPPAGAGHPGREMPGDRSSLPPPGPPPVVVSPGGGAKRRKTGLVLAAAAVAAVAIAGGGYLVTMLGDDEGDPKAGKVSPSGSAESLTPPTDPMLVRLDTKTGWPNPCHADIGRYTPGGAVTTLVSGGKCDMLPEYSRDKSKIAFTRRDGSRHEAWVMNADGGGQRRVGEIAGGRVTWSRDGNSLIAIGAVNGVGEIFQYPMDGGRPKQLTTDHSAKDDPMVSFSTGLLAFWTRRDGVETIYTMDPGNPSAPWKKVTGDGVRAVDPEWSPDGKTIAYTRGRSGDAEIWTIEADGTGARKLTSGDEHDMDPAWSPDGKWICYVRGDVRKPTLRVIRADGRGDRPFGPKSGTVGHPNWT
ncbi:protein kinase domain-containing protein [Spirillospora sp. CA-294931]|uniref:protein kinase domain-containing protein n=1 Tax=Spirillospora sp. CA-294931 TaxID=3240042 RepID=UPI003D8AE5C0